MRRYHGRNPFTLANPQMRAGDSICAEPGDGCGVGARLCQFNFMRPNVTAGGIITKVLTLAEKRAMYNEKPKISSMYWKGLASDLTIIETGSLRYFIMIVEQYGCEVDNLRTF